MSSKHNSVKHEHKNHEKAEKKEEINSSKSNDMLMIAAILIIGLVVGAIIGALASNVMVAYLTIDNSNAKDTNLVLLKNKVELYLNDNLLGAEGKAQGVSVYVDDFNNDKSGIYSSIVYMSQGGVVQPVSYIYATATDIIVGGQKFNLNTPIELPVASDTNTTDSSSQELVKSDKPTVELFIWSYCPGGNAALNPFASVALLLKDVADLKVVPYYVGHGQYELNQNMVMACIESNVDQNKYFAYLDSFYEDVYSVCSVDSNKENCDKVNSIALMKKVGIESTAIYSCVDTNGQALFEKNYLKAQEYGVNSSPTFIINGTEQRVSRNEDAIKQAICSAFNVEPEVCSTELSTTASSVTGSC
ncbi:MAG: thioredoxin domain-containing protein [Candidatus ainarchaeum sp.]|nr:thioredoxin domain-containing protein [Candidatus ainarchaeum sp.]